MRCGARTAVEVRVSRVGCSQRLDTRARRRQRACACRDGADAIDSAIGDCHIARWHGAAPWRVYRHGVGDDDGLPDDGWARIVRDYCRRRI